jgi:predicted SprT family Zn-dependent metalloprotease
VYEVLRDHQKGASEALRLLHAYLQPIIERFFGDLPLPALSWDKAHWRTLAWYMEKDGLALKHRINLNSLHADRPLSEILRSLAHELCHCWQQVYGKPPKPSSVRDHNYHNSEFRRRMQEIGIPCNKRGVSLGMEEPFVGFLKELGVEADSIPFKQANDEEDQKGPARPGSRLKPWSCGCSTRVWASAGVLVIAACLKCRKLFQPQSAHLPIEITETLREIQKLIDSSLIVHI